MQGSSTVRPDRPHPRLRGRWIHGAASIVAASVAVAGCGLPLDTNPAAMHLISGIRGACRQTALKQAARLHHDYRFWCKQPKILIPADGDKPAFLLSPPTYRGYATPDGQIVESHPLKTDPNVDPGLLQAIPPVTDRNVMPANKFGFDRMRKRLDPLSGGEGFKRLDF